MFPFNLTSIFIKIKLSLMIRKDKKITSVTGIF